MKNKKKLIIIGIVILLIVLVIMLIIATTKKLDTYIYDNNGNEIAVIKYGDASFFDSISSHYLAASLNELVNDLKEQKNMSEEEAKNTIVTSGFKIYTCQNSNIQKELDNIYVDNTNFNDTEESATIVLDSNIGEVLAVIGGRNQIENKNRATNAFRQPGNMLSFISIYACGLEKNKFSLETKYNNSSIKYAIANGSDVVASKALKDIGINSSYGFINDLNIHLENDDNNENALATGNLSKGLTLLDISSAYRSVLNEGIYKEPIFYSKVLHANDKLYIVNEQKLTEVMKQETCELLKSCIKQTIEDKDIYIYSSTVNNNKDSWSCINTDKYTISTWYGYDDMTVISSSNNEALNISQKVYNSIKIY